MTKYWLSWWQDFDKLGAFELHSPWWISGSSWDDKHSICAAIVADNMNDAIEKVYNSYDVKPTSLTFRFINKKEDNWSPFSERFPKAKWMEVCWND